MRPKAGESTIVNQDNLLKYASPKSEPPIAQRDVANTSKRKGLQPC